MSQKRKQNTLAQQKLIHAQHKNEYLRKLRSILQVLGDESLFDMFSAKQLDRIYHLRVVSPKIINISRYSIHSADLKLMETELKDSLAEKQIELGEKSQGKTISYADYASFILPFEFLIAKDLEAILDSYQKERLLSFLKGSEERINKLIEVVKQHATVLEFINSDLTRQYFCAESQFTHQFKNGGYGVHFVIELNFARPKVQHLLIDNISRPVIAVEYYTNKTTTAILEMPVSALNIPSLFPDLKLPVYIQAHAIHRLRERIHDKMDFYLRQNLFDSVQKPQAFTNKSGSLLLEYPYRGLKIGYLKIDIIEGMVVIRTFLFLTHDGTPEGKKLQKLTGLQKEDVKYLHIDKLETLIDSDILDNEEVCRLFKEAGCGSLLEICRLDKEKPILKDQNNEGRHILTTSFINSYLDKKRAMQE